MDIPVESICQFAKEVITYNNFISAVKAGIYIIIISFVEYFFLEDF